jgi:predicted glycosyltransferase
LNENNELISHDHRRSVTRAQEDRKRTILETFDWLRPDILLIELFPFGRKKFAGELMPLIQAARNLDGPRPLTVCSLRDILVGRQEKQNEYDERAAAISNEYFDLILVHSDPSFARLEESFQAYDSLHTNIQYTGFVAPASAQSIKTRRAQRFKKIIVSAGGGMVGESLLRTAVDAYKLFSKDERLKMEIIAGPFLPKQSWQALRKLTNDQPGLRLRRQVSDLCSEMRRASVSVSQCGYNTTLDFLRAGVPALVVPFSAGGTEDEQLKRARRLSELGAIRVLKEEYLNPERLAEEIRQLLTSTASIPSLDMNGARNSVQTLKTALANNQLYSHITPAATSAQTRVNG